MSTESPSRRETLAGLSILVLLTGIALGVVLVRQTPNPAVLVYQEAGRLPAAPAAAGDAVPLPAGFTAMSPPEVFGPETLSDKIDGKAELYLSAGFERLSTRRMSAADAPETWMEIFAYRMEDPRSAFAVYSAQQRAVAEPLERFRYGYLSENALFFVHGAFYVEIVSSAVSPDPGPMLRLAAAFADAHGAAEAAVSEQEVFPKQDRVPDSIELQSANVFGFERLDDVFLARYRIEDTELTAFASPRASVQEAEELTGAYTDFLVRFGGRLLPVDFPAPGARLIEIFGVYELVFSHQETLAGVHEAEDPASAVLLGRRLYSHLGGGES